MNFTTGTGTLTIPVLNDDANTGDTSVTITLTGATAATETIVISTDAPSATGIVTEDDIVDPIVQKGAQIFGVNAGGPAVTTTDGVVYEASNGFTNVLGTFGGSDSVDYTGDGQDNADDTVYETEVYGGKDDASDLTFTRSGLAPGDYILTLKFAEIFLTTTSPGARVFDVAVNGVSEVINDLNLVTAAGPDKAYDVDIPVTVGQDGILTVALDPSADNAKISALALFEAVEVDPTAVAVSVADVTVAEDDANVTVTFTREGNTDGEMIVTYSTANGTAEAGLDYTAVASGTVVFGDGDLTATATIALQGDSDDEGDQDFTVTIDSVEAAGKTITIADNEATVTLTDNDVPLAPIGNAPTDDLDQDGIANQDDEDIDGDAGGASDNSTSADGVLNIDETFIYDATNTGTALAAGQVVRLDFDTDGTPFENGLTGALLSTNKPNPEIDLANADVSGGALNVTATTGDHFNSNNTQQNALVAGFTAVEGLRVETRFAIPDFNPATAEVRDAPLNFQAAGVVIGFDQNNLVKAVFGRSAAQFQLVQDNAGGLGTSEVLTSPVYPSGLGLADVAEVSISLEVFIDDSGAGPVAKARAFATFFDTNGTAITGTENLAIGEITLEDQAQITSGSQAGNKGTALASQVLSGDVLGAGVIQTGTGANIGFDVSYQYLEVTGLGTPVDVAPTAVTLENVVSLPENGDTTAAIKVADIVVADDGLSPVTLSLGGGDAGLFEIVDGELLLKEGTALDFETQSSFDVVVIATDGTGSASSASLGALVTNVNDAPTGAVTITGTPSQGETLTADISTLADADGLGPIAYQWFAGDVAIAGATEASFTLTEAEVGAEITVVASYTDLGGTPESVSSAATAEVTNVNDAPTGAVTITGTPSQGETLTADISTLADADGLGPIAYQWFAGDVAIAGATEASFMLTEAEVGAEITVVASYTDLGGTPESVSSAATAEVTNVNDAPTGAVTITGTPSQGETLTADISTLADADGLGPIAYQWFAGDVAIAGATEASFMLTEAEVGAEITVVASYTDLGGTPESVSSAATAEVTNVNDAPTGAVTITGTPSQGETLTADISTLADADGLGPIAYQWFAGDVAIAGATEASFVLTQAEVGAEITVVASYTDLGGTAESVPSAATALVEAATLISIGDAPTKVETGDDGFTTLDFALTSAAGAAATVDLEYSVDGGTPIAARVIFGDTGAATLAVPVENDDEDNADLVTVTLVSTSTSGFAVSAAPATGTVIEDDTPMGGADDAITVTGDVEVGDSGTPYVLADNVTEIDTSASTGSTNLVGNSQDNTFKVGTGQDTIDLQQGGGSDTISGTAAALAGTTVANIEEDDRIVIEGGQDATIVSVAAGSTVVTIDPDGNESDDSDQFTVTFAEDNLVPTITDGVLTVGAPPVSGDPIRIEAEDFTSSVVYAAQTVGSASGDEVIFLPRNGATGSATYDLFDKGVGAGTYDIEVGYYDENDGVSVVGLSLNGTSIGSITFDEDTPSNAASSLNIRSQTFFGVIVGGAGELVLNGMSDAGEFARIDYIEFTPVSGGGSGNTAPFAPNDLPDQAVDENAPFSFDAGRLFADAEQENLSFTATSDLPGDALPAGVTFNTDTGVFGGAPTEVGTYVITVVASDDAPDNPLTSEAEQFTLSVGVVNEAPELGAPIADQTVQAGDPVAFSVAGSFSDPNDDPLTYSFDGELPAGVTFDAETGEFGGTVDALAPARSYEVTVTATDTTGTNTGVSDTFLFNVTGSGVDTRPTVRLEAEDGTLVDGFFIEKGSRIRLLADDAGTATYDLSEIDPGDYLIRVAYWDENDGESTIGVSVASDGGAAFSDGFTLDENTPSNAASSQNFREKTLEGTLTLGANGLLTLTGQSAGNGSDWEFVRVDWIELIPVGGGGGTGNFAPSEAGGGIPDTTVGLGAITIDTAAAFADPEEDALTYALVSGPGWIAVDEATGLITGTPPAGGVYEVVVSAEDAANNPGILATSDFTLTVDATLNQAPTVTPLGPINLDQNASLEELVSFSDPEGQALTYALAAGAPAWLDIDPNNGALTGTPGNADVGVVTVEVIASDPLGATASDFIEITVNNVNDAPVLGTATLADQSAVQDQFFAYDLPADAFTDADLAVDPSETLTYSATLEGGADLPSWLGIDPTTGALSGTPDSVADLSVVITVTDAAGASVSAAPIAIEVTSSVVPADPVTIEAEDFTGAASNYVDNSFPGASGGQVIRVQNNNNPSSIETDISEYAGGSYTVGVTFVDETDGVSTAKVFIDEMEIGEWSFDGTAGTQVFGGTPGTFTQPGNFRYVEFDVPVVIRPDSVLRLEVQGNSGEYGRIDSVTLVPAEIPAENQAPTAVVLTPVLTEIAEDADITTAIKIADIAVTDDGLGVNTLGLTGADAALFEIVGSELFLKADTALDFETQSQLDVAVTADDAEFPASPDATSAPFSLAVTDVLEPPTVSVGVASSTTEGDTANSVATLSLSETLDQAITVRLVMTPGASVPATIAALANGGDVAFDAAGATTIDVIIPANTLSFQVPFEIFADAVIEPFETFRISVTGANVGNAINGAAAQVPFDATPADGGILDGTAPPSDDDFAPDGDLDGDGTINSEDDDIDADGTLNAADPFAYDFDNGMTLATGETKTFEFDTDGTIFQNGMTGFLQGTANGGVFEENTGATSVAGGLMTVNPVTTGDTGNSNNPQDDAVVGVKNGTFVAKAVVLNPWVGAAANPGGFDQLGLVLGLDSDDMIKLVFGQTGQVVEFQKQETTGTTTTATKYGGSTPGGNSNFNLSSIGLGLDGFASAEITFEVVSTSPTAATVTGTIVFIAASGAILATQGMGTAPIGGALAAALADAAVGVAVGFTHANQVVANDVTFVAQMDSLTITEGDGGVAPVNMAPTAVTLTNVIAGIAEDTSGATKVADIVVDDDGQGDNVLALIGADADLFEIFGQELFLKADQTLDATANPTLDVAVTVNDASVGSDPDATSAPLAIPVTDAGTPVDQIVLRINAFGPEVAATDGSGVNWLADLKDVSGTPANENSEYLNLVSTDPAQDRGDEPTAGYTGSIGAIPAGVPETVLNTARSSNAAFSYDIPVGDIGGPGTFRVNLYFAELFVGNQTAGDRVFDIGVEGDLATGDNFDPSVPNGGGDLRVLSYEVTVGDSVLNIDFAQELAANGGADNPIINAIEIVRLGAPTPDETPPTAAITLTGPVDADAALGVSVALSDASGIDTTTLGAGDLAVTGAAGAVTYLSFASGVATYSVAAPAGGWIDEATITVTLKAGEVDDLAVPANTNAATSQSLTLDIGSTGIGNAEEAFAAQDDIVKDVIYDDGVTGSAVLEIMKGNNNIQSSNFGANSFEVTNTGDKKISAIFIDVSSALYQDSVFDPDGKGGDLAFRAWQVDSKGNTGGFIGGGTGGYFLPGEDPLPNTTGTGIASNGGYKGAMVKFDASDSGGFQNGETVGFSGDMDPNSIAGLTKASVDGTAILGWDVGGISGHELIGSLFTVLFDDGTTASGQLASDGSSAGSHALATQGAAPAAAPGIAVNGFQPGQNGTYGGTLPTITVTGNPGDKVQITMTKGFNPVTETDNGIAGLVEDRLERYDFKASNAFDAQTKIVTIGANGTFDASTLFDYDDAINNNVGSGSFPGDDVAQIGFVATKVQSGGAELPIGPTTAPIYLTSNGTPVTGDPTGGTGGGAEGYFQIVGSGPAAYFKMEIEDARIANGGTDPGGKWTFVDAPEGGNQNGFTGDGYYLYGSNTSTAINGVLNSEVLEFTILVPEGQTGTYEFQFRVSRDGVAAVDQQNDLWLNFKEAGKSGPGDIEDYLTNTTNEPEPLSNGYIKIYGGPNNGNWGVTNKYDGDPGDPPARIAITEAGLYTIQIAGRSQGFHVDSFWLEKIDGQGPVASSANSAFVPTGPAAPQITGSATGATVGDGATFAFDVDATDLNGDTLSYSISGGADGDLFEIDGATGEVSFTTAADFGSPTDAGGNNVYDLQVTVSDPGNLTAVRDYAVTVTDVVPPTILTIPIDASADDWEQFGGAGSGDLEFGLNGSAQTVGLRFDGITIPNGAVLQEAFIRFTAQETQTGAANLIVGIEGTENAAGYTNATAPQTRTTVDDFDWKPEAWTEGQSYELDVLDLVSGVVENDGIDDGALSFIIRPDTNPGSRVADSFDAPGDDQPELVLIWGDGLL